MSFLLCEHGVDTYRTECPKCIGKKLVMQRNYIYDLLSKPKAADGLATGGGYNYGGINRIPPPANAVPVCPSPPSPIPPPPHVGVFSTNNCLYDRDMLMQRLKDDVENLHESEAAAFFIERWLKKLK